MGDFFSIYSHGFLRASASPIRISLADPAGNAAEVVKALDAAAAAGSGLIAFPELCLSGYAIDDLLQQSVVLDGVLQSRSGRQARPDRRWPWLARRCGMARPSTTAPW